MNIAILTGRLTRDPEVKTLQTGSTVLSFTLAVDAGKDKPTDFIDCEAWGTTADFIGKWFKKGSPMSVMGEIKPNKYEKDGQTITRVRVRVNKVEFVPKTNDSSNNGGRKTEAIESDFGGLDF